MEEEVRQLPEFEEFKSIPRLAKNMVVTEKIDGTNAQIYITEDGQIFAGSRNRWLRPTKLEDNFGFARWVEDNKDKLISLGPGRHFGEWWGAGIQRRYGQTEKRFSLFNTARWKDQPLPDGVSVVPVLYEGAFSTDMIDHQLEALANHGSVAAPGFMQPEGVVVYHTASRSLFKKTFDDTHKGEKNA